MVAKLGKGPIRIERADFYLCGWHFYYSTWWTVIASYGKLLLKLKTQFNRNQNVNDENQDFESENNNQNTPGAENVPKRLYFKTDLDNNFEKTNEGKSIYKFFYWCIFLNVVFQKLIFSIQLLKRG